MASTGYLLSGVNNPGMAVLMWSCSTFGAGTNFVYPSGRADSGTTATELQTQFILPYDCTIDLAYCHMNTRGTGFVGTFTLRKGSGGAMADTAITFIADNTDPNSPADPAGGFVSKDITHSVDFTAGDNCSLKVVGSAAGSAPTNLIITMRIRPR